MMLYPPINKLLKKADSKFSLVIATAKRARTISDIQIDDPDHFSKEKGYRVNKPVAIAVNEIYEGKVYITNAGSTRKMTDIERAFYNAQNSIK